uniref:Dynein axonemal assembly factor 1 homolog n=1 Tax=Rhodnius prolixus TaxID=13249 RepID=T1I877_RHOPR
MPTKFLRLTTLYLCNNHLTSLNGLEKLTFLQSLNVSDNYLQTVSGLQHNHCLQRLNVDYQITEEYHALNFDPRTIEGIRMSLKELSCRSNCIKDLDELVGLQKLEVLDLKYNEIDNLDKVLVVLETFPYLFHLNLKGNQVQEANDYKKRIIGSQSINIRLLDDVTIPGRLRQHYIRINKNIRANPAVESVKEEFGSLPRGLREEFIGGFFERIAPQCKENCEERRGFKFKHKIRLNTKNKH